jgi:hypothetical protein
LSWDEYKEKHKEQLGDRLGAGVERETQEFRKMLDAERNKKVCCCWPAFPLEYCVSCLLRKSRAERRRTCAFMLACLRALRGEHTQKNASRRE